MADCACYEYQGDNPHCPIEAHRNMYADFRGREAMVRQLEETRRKPEIAQHEIEQTARSLRMDFTKGV